MRQMANFGNILHAKTIMLLEKIFHFEFWIRSITKIKELLQFNANEVGIKTLSVLENVA
jgi:hypothetical protein